MEDKEQPKEQSYEVEVYRGEHLTTVITVKAKDHAEASTKAFNEFFDDIKVKIKRAYG